MTQNPLNLQHETYLNSPDWEQLNEDLIIGFTTKNGGVSSGHFQSLNLGLHVHDDPGCVTENRKILASAVNMPLEHWVYADQVHDSSIYKARREDRSKGTMNYASAVPETDGLYTDEEDLMLSLCYADCVPLFFYEPEKRLVGTAHAGWKGSVLDIGGKMARTWTQNEGVPGKSIYAIIGPSIGPCCYTVDDYVIDRVNNALSKDFPSPYEEVSAGQYSLDLKLLNKYLLLKAGLSESRILTSPLCTSCESSLFFSHRRDQGKTGRMAGFIGLKGRQKQL
ncbi:peptidoglycan editing factor PgeF [Metabacillus sp. cB07]|uniref:peptidoglycan editing factor PgeF n=1 Tax=Metabacillus sp. cB07 TaxID=2806989 RepID=UPI001939F697|nr:peptidoglycan editing factor PgeF [Metabacillus sp. cB07]